MALMKQSGTRLVVFCAVTCGAFLIEVVSPKPYSQYGGCVFLVCFVSLSVFRSVSEIFNANIAKLAQPYIVATFIVLSPVVVFASGMFQAVGDIVLLSIVGITTFYWTVSKVVTSFKETFLKQ